MAVTAAKMSLASKVDSAGRLMIPHQLRKELQLSEGEEVVLRLEDGELRVTTRAESLRRAQQALAALRDPSANRSVVDRFIADRRREAAQE